jgi:putative transposase
MYARGMSTREIQGHLRELYGLEVSPDLVSAVTDAVLEEVADWQNRPLEALYPLVFLDALRVKVRDEGTVRNKAVHVALGVRPDGTKEVLGLWIEQTEGAKFRLRVMTELRQRGVEDILIAVVDGLKGFPDAIAAVFPKTQVQACIVHLIRGSLDLVSYKDRKAVAAALKGIYRARDAEAGRAARSRTSPTGPGAASIRPSPRPGGATGRRSSPSTPSPPRCAGSSTRRTPSRRCTPSCAAPSGPAATSPPTTPCWSCSFSC